jgi:hypothetical protein
VSTWSYSPRIAPMTRPTADLPNPTTRGDSPHPSRSTQEWSSVKSRGERAHCQSKLRSGDPAQAPRLADCAATVFGGDQDDGPRGVAGQFDQ